MWKEAKRTAGHALEIDPYSADGMRTLVESILNGSADINEARRVLETFPAENKVLVNSNVGDVRDMMGGRAYVFVLARDFEAALKVWETVGNAAVDERRRHPPESRSESWAAISWARKLKRRKPDSCWRRDYSICLTTFLR